MNPLHAPQAGAYTCAPALLTDTWKDLQGTQGYSTITDTLTEIIRFSGWPDRIEIWCLDNPASIEFADEQGRPLQQIQMEAGTHYEPNIRAHALHARNVNAGFNARLQVVGKWAMS